jgi:hypothetical protein
MCRITKVHKKIVDRLPERYNIPIKLYKTVTGMILSEARDQECTYSSLCKYYNRYLNKHTYMNTKYYKSEVPKGGTYSDIVAFAGTPIKIASENIKRGEDEASIAFLILHELNHVVNKERSEKKCDKFAARWCRILIKEKIIGGIR